MSESTSLIPAEMLVTVGDETALAELTKASSYLPSLRVFDGSSKAAKANKVGTGDLAVALGKDKYHSFGKEVTVLNLGYRPRASIFQGDARPIDYFDESSEEFKAVTEKAMKRTKGYQSGLEYLVYIPVIEKFCCFYLGNASGRYVSEDMKALSGNGATIRSQFVERGENSWWAAEILPCTTPFELPTTEAMKEAAKLFTDTAKSTDEPKDESTGRER